MTYKDVTQETFWTVWEYYGYSKEEVRELMDAGRITHKAVFSTFFHWYIDGKLMFGESLNPDDTYEYITYREKGDEKDVH